MMQHTPTSGWMRLAYAALLPLFAGTMFLCNPARAQVQAPPRSPYGIIVVDDLAAMPDTTGRTVPFSLIEQKPTFQGGNANTFSKWVAQHLNYPEDAKKAGIEGRVMVAFDICEDGAVRNAKVLRGVNEALDAEALRVISSSPDWKPGIQDGKAVKVTFQFPVIFMLRDNKVTLGSEARSVNNETGQETHSFQKLSVENDRSGSVPSSLIEQKPTFQGGDVNAFSKWVSQHLNYPEDAKKAGIEGRVLVAFDVCDDGVVRNVKVLRGVNEALDAEALRVISSSPDWKPGIQNGKPVKVTYRFPVIFKLNGEEPATAPSANSQ